MGRIYDIFVNDKYVIVFFVYALSVIYKDVSSSLLCFMAKARKRKKITRGERSAGHYPERISKLGKRIKELRKKHGYVSALDFALEKDVSFTQMARWETGKNMTFESLCKMADSFGISLSELLDGI